MPGPEDKRDELLKAPPTKSERTTPFGSETLGGAPTATPSPLEVRYEVLGELGRGGMGIVYRARDRETDEIVALKVIKPQIAAEPAILERFKDELRLARKITHKHVCRTYELLRFDDMIVIAMEYVDGRSLHAYLEAGAGVAVSRGLEWARQICAGLREAHAQGVVHRDLKPENILIDRRGHVKVMDFGIARSLGLDATQTGSVIGTPAYMAPEQAEGKPVDQRTDVYAMGLIFYEMFTGRQAFTAEAPLGLVHRQIHDKPARPSAAEPFLPEFVSGAIEKCLEKDPIRRFQSVQELEAALTEQGGTEPVVGNIAEVELPARLMQWQTSDWLLLASSIAGVALFLHFFPLTNLASRHKVTFDRSVLRRSAQDYARKLGAPISRERALQIWGHPWRYDYIADNSGARAALDATNNPVPYWVWEMVWENPSDGSEVQVLIDSSGAITRFERESPTKGIAAGASLEEARPLAEKAVREFFNCDPASLHLLSSGNVLRGGSLASEFRWAGTKEFQGLRERCDVVLVGAEIQALNHFYSPPPGYRGKEPLRWGIYAITVIFVLLLVLGFSQIRRVNILARWRIIVVITGLLLGMWLAGVLEPAPLAAIVMIGMAFALAGLVASITLEQAFSRVGAARIVSFLRLLDGRASSEACGVAILRGTLLGLVLLGLEAALIWLGMAWFGTRADIYYHIDRQAWLLSRWWPGGQMLVYSLFQGMGMTLIISFVASLALRFTRRAWVVAALTAALVAGASMPWSLGRIQPNDWMLTLHAIECLMLVWVLLRYDVLTLFAAVFTFAFCLENWSMVSMLSPTGAAGEWAAFAIWGVIVLLATMVAAQSTLRGAYRRFTAAFG